MSQTLTPEEHEEMHVDAMGRDLGRIFYRLSNECHWLHVKWAEFVELFATKPARIVILNRAAPAFFHLVQDTLWNDTLLHISKLTDEPLTAGQRRTLSVKQLLRLVDAEIREETSRRVAAAAAAAKFARDWRHRSIAHKDLQLALGEQLRPLESATREKTAAAITAIADVLTFIETHYTGEPALFTFDSQSEGALALLITLREGIEEREARGRRIKTRSYTEEDLRRLRRREF